MKALLFGLFLLCIAVVGFVYSVLKGHDRDLTRYFLDLNENYPLLFPIALVVAAVSYVTLILIAKLPVQNEENDKEDEK